VRAQLGEQEAVRGDPADGLEHVQRAADQVRRSRRRRQRRQRQAERGGLFSKPANPELAALIGHRGLLGGYYGRRQRQALEETGDQKQRDHGDAATQPRKRKLG
jgi:hypothetical protein